MHKAAASAGALILMFENAQRQRLNMIISPLRCCTSDECCTLTTTSLSGQQVAHLPRRGVRRVNR
jgi:hypothetical protein